MDSQIEHILNTASPSVYSECPNEEKIYRTFFKTPVEVSTFFEELPHHMKELPESNKIKKEWIARKILHYCRNNEQIDQMCETLQRHTGICFSEF